MPKESSICLSPKLQPKLHLVLELDGSNFLIALELQDPTTLTHLETIFPTLPWLLAKERRPELMTQRIKRLHQLFQLICLMTQPEETSTPDNNTLKQQLHKSMMLESLPKNILSSTMNIMSQ